MAALIIIGCDPVMTGEHIKTQETLSSIFYNLQQTDNLMVLSHCIFFFFKEYFLPLLPHLLFPFSLVCLPVSFSPISLSLAVSVFLSSIVVTLLSHWPLPICSLFSDVNVPDRFTLQHQKSCNRSP